MKKIASKIAVKNKAVTVKGSIRLGKGGPASDCDCVDWKGCDCVSWKSENTKEDSVINPAKTRIVKQIKVAK